MFAQRTSWNLENNRFSLTLARLRREGKPLLDLTISNPTTCGIAFDEHLLHALSDPKALQYEPEAQGLLSARKAVTQYYASLPERGAAVSPEQIFLTTGTSEAYSYAFRLLCDPDDEVLVPHPGYPLFDFLASIQDVHLRPYPLIYDHGWHVDMHVLEEAITERTRAIVVVHPNNPTGSFIRPGEREHLIALCSKHDIAIIADEVFLDYDFDIPGHTFATNNRCLTFTLSGLSKISGLPQMKVAWMVVSGPGSIKDAAIARLDVIADTYLSLNTPMQVALPAWLEVRHHFQSQLQARLTANLRELDGQLAAAPKCQRMEVQGGWYATLRVPALQSDEDLAIELMEKYGVAVHPGHFFDFPMDGYLVLSLMTPENDFREGLRRILHAIG
jgi:alanine-synthesizing transaminase